MNKEKGVGTASVAISFITYGLASLLFSSFLVQKLDTKNSQLLGIVLVLPFIAYNLYPTWIIMLPAAVLRGFGNSLLWAAQCTYFNESSILFCKVERNRRRSKYMSNSELKYEDSDVDKEITSFKSEEQEVEQLSPFVQLGKTVNNPVSNSDSARYHVNASSVRLTVYKYKKDGLSENKLFSKEKSTETTEDIEGHNLKLFNEVGFSKTLKNVSDERKQEIFLDSFLETIKDSDRTAKYQSYVDSTKSFFFGIHGLAYQSATVFSSLISYYILRTEDKEDYNSISNRFCGANSCSTNEEAVNNSIEEVPIGTRYLLIGVCIACGIVAPLLILLFLDRMVRTKEDVKLLWDHVFNTIKHMKKKNQLLMIPFTVGTSLCKGFYVADFTKFYIACAWSVSHIGLITLVYGTTSALSSIIIGVIIKYVGRRSVMVLCQIINISNFVFLLFWSPDAQQPYLFYIQGGIFGMIYGIFSSQTRAIYGIFFEGDEETAFSSCNLCSSVGWSLPFIYNDFFCTSVKIYIMLAFSCAGLLGYLLAERSYSLRNKQTGLSK
ncbi:UNC93-like protein [Araneus ventricosus]|uniref:UNC93-like protein n=1 Tax=Araneus ventricosus TaxID=182803 RepID=A0A4Y2PUP1_ARAVE|nr:UNC93-like protein [Araneus ventricosus]